MNYITRAIIIVVASLIGASVGKVGFSDALPFSIGGGVIAAISIGIAGIFSSNTEKFEKSIPPQKLLGIRIATAGFMLALTGWCLAVFASLKLGLLVAGPGCVIGVIGMTIHFINLLRK